MFIHSQGFDESSKAPEGENNFPKIVVFVSLNSFLSLRLHEARNMRHKKESLIEIIKFLVIHARRAAN